MENSLKESSGHRLNSWKEIAAFFGRDERTVRRWEKDLSLPVHRIPGGSKGRVFAFESELQEWLLTSQAAQQTAASPAPETIVDSTPKLATGEDLRLGLRRKWVAILAICVLMGAVYGAYHVAHKFRVQASGDSRPVAGNGGTGSAGKSQAEDLYLVGRFYWNKRTPDDLNRAVDYFTQAIVRDPNYAKPYVGLADCYNLLREFSAMPANQAYPRALAAATKAVELDQSSADAHTSLAFVTFFWNWDAPTAEREFQQALALNPNDARAHHWYASFLFAQGRYSESLEQIEAARRLDPSSEAILADKGLILNYVGQTQAGLDLLKQLEAEDPSLASPHRYLTQIYFDRKDFPNYLAEWDKVAVLTHDAQELATVKAAERGFSRRGYSGMLEATLECQNALYERGSLPAYSLALTYARLGNKPEALRYLGIAFDQRESALLALSNEPSFALLHDERKYTDLLAQIRSSPKPASAPVNLIPQSH